MRKLSLSYEDALFDTSYTNLSFVLPLAKGGLSARIYLFDGGRMDIYRVDGTKETKTAQQDQVITLGYAREFGDLSVGSSIKNLSSKLIDKYTASAIALDLGVIYKMDEATMGASIQNIGGKAHI